MDKRIEEIIESEQDVLRKVSDVVADATRRVAETPSRFTELTRSVMEGAVKALQRVQPEDPHATLRQVVEGLGDGLQRSAQATRLALEEAAAEGRAFAAEDLRRVAEDLEKLSAKFADIVEAEARSAFGHTADQVARLRGHAERTLQSIRPSITSALEALLRDPVGLAGETARTAVEFTREATGMLFSKIGEMLQAEKGRSPTE